MVLVVVMMTTMMMMIFIIIMTIMMLLMMMIPEWYQRNFMFDSNILSGTKPLVLTWAVAISDVKRYLLYTVRIVRAVSEPETG